MPIKQLVQTGDLPLVKESVLVKERVLRRISSHELLDGKKEVVIVHDGDLYRLRLTTFGKLILTK